MTKILILRETSHGKGGIENYCCIMEQMFRETAGYEVLPGKDLPLVPIPLFHNIYRWGAIKKAIQQADIIQINGYTALSTTQALLLALYYRKRIIYSPHWHPFHCLQHPFFGKLFFNVFIRPFARRTNTVVTINNEDTAYFSRFHHHVVRIPHFSTLAKGKPKDKIPNMILFVGNLDNHVKGSEHLIHIPLDLYQIHCVGKGQLPQRNDLLQHTNITDEQLDALYAQASLLVVPSKYEAFSYVALEALLHNTPVVMSERVRIADYLKDIQGYQTFRYGDYTGFVKAIQSTIGTPVDLEKVQKLFSPERIHSMYISLFSTL